MVEGGTSIPYTILNRKLYFEHMTENGLSDDPFYLKFEAIYKFTRYHFSEKSITWKELFLASHTYLTSTQSHDGLDLTLLIVTRNERCDRDCAPF